MRMQITQFLGAFVSRACCLRTGIGEHARRLPESSDCVPPLPVLRERAGVRVISIVERRWCSKSPSPQPSPGIPGEGVTKPLPNTPRVRHTQKAIAQFTIAAAVAILTFAQLALAAPTQEEVFKSIQDNVGSSSTDSRKFLLYACVTGGVIILLALFSQRRKREVIPKALNNHGKLLKEIMKGVPVRPREVKQLKTLAEQTPIARGNTVQDPLTLLLCPSVLTKAVQNPRCKADRRVLQQVLRKIVMTNASARPANEPAKNQQQSRASNETARRVSPGGRSMAPRRR